MNKLGLGILGVLFGLHIASGGDKYGSIWIILGAYIILSEISRKNQLNQKWNF